MRLYGIEEVEVRATVDSPDSFSMEADRWIAVKSIPGCFYGFPLKVVYTMEGNDVVVITTYPLKRGFKR